MTAARPAADAEDPGNVSVSLRVPKSVWDGDKRSLGCHGQYYYYYYCCCWAKLRGSKIGPSLPSSATDYQQLKRPLEKKSGEGFGRHVPQQDLHP